MDKVIINCDTCLFDNRVYRYCSSCRIGGCKGYRDHFIDGDISDRWVIRPSLTTIDVTPSITIGDDHDLMKGSLWLAHEHMKLYLPHYKEGFSVYDNLERAIKQAESVGGGV